MNLDPAVTDWLLEGDPSVVWQTQRDLLDRPDEAATTRSEVAARGWGRRLLDLQDPSGRWADGLYQPKWTSTTYTMLLMRRLGVDPANTAACRGAQVLLDDADWVDGGVSYWSGRLEAERCVNGMVLSIGSYFDLSDDRVDSIAGLLIRSRLVDGGWNCRDQRGDDLHSSFHTTLSVLEGLHLWRSSRDTAAADEAIASGEEFMLAHRMYRSHRTGHVIDRRWTRFSFPPRWHYDVLRGLDYLQGAGARRDSRLSGAIELVDESRRPDGRWPIGPSYSGEVHFKMESGRAGGRWNTLRALRVLRWWEDQPA
jgi:hypothetical protein